MGNFEFKKKFGQNFLTDKNLLETIVQKGGVSSDDVVLEIKNKEIPLQPGAKIYRYEIDDMADFTIENIKNEIGTVIENKKNPGVWGIRNLTDMTWYRHTPGGKEEIRKKDEVVPVIRTNIIKFGTFSEGTIK